LNKLFTENSLAKEIYLFGTRDYISCFHPLTFLQRLIFRAKKKYSEFSTKFLPLFEQEKKLEKDFWNDEKEKELNLDWFQKWDKIILKEIEKTNNFHLENPQLEKIFSPFYDEPIKKVENLRTIMSEIHTLMNEVKKHKKFFNLKFWQIENRMFSWNEKRNLEKFGLKKNHFSCFQQFLTFHQKIILQVEILIHFVEFSWRFPEFLDKCSSIVSIYNWLCQATRFWYESTLQF
jgi:hypothetical protein